MKRIIGWIVTSVGLLAAVAAVGAGFLGIDRDAGWGPARTFLLVVGLTLMLLPYARGAYRWIRAAAGSVLGRLTPRMPTQEESAKATKASQQPASLAQETRRELKLSLTLAFSFLLACAAFTWVISAGYWTSWPKTTDYYHQLAEGFRAGETHLLAEPDPRLLALENPYEVANREGITYPWDASFYNGRFYLYWGPAPALVTIVLEGITRTPIGDHHLVWLFSVTTVLFLLLVLRLMWREVFPDLRVRSVLPLAIGAALLNPLPWLMSRPAVYEAAISSGQAFFVGGLLWLAPVLWRQEIPYWRLAMGGMFWALAVGSRVTLAPAVAILPLATSINIFFSDRRSGRVLKRTSASLAALLLPLAFGAVLLGWYNLDRFGSILELGHRYQLGRWNMHDQYDLVASIRNLPINLYNYLVNPPNLLRIFPYLKPTWGQYAIPLLRYSAPSNYHTEQVTGILVTTPLLALAFLPLGRWLGVKWENLDRKDEMRIPIPDLYSGGPAQRAYAGLTLAVLMLGIPMMIVSFISTRHELDVVPSLGLLACLAVGMVLQEAQARNEKCPLLRAGVWVFVLWSTAAGPLLAVTGYASRFESLNPVLFDALTRFFTR